jgi:hypothetical protein
MPDLKQLVEVNQRLLQSYLELNQIDTRETKAVVDADEFSRI